MGTIYRRKRVLWVKYYRNGKPYYESSRSNKKEVAKRLLKRREGEISKGELPGICFDKVRFDELAQDYLTDYRINGKKTLSKAGLCVKHLKGAFEGMRATEITTARIKDYIQGRMEEGLSNASINREMAALKRMFYLGARCTPPKVSRVPYIPMLKESNTRKGFYEYEEYIALKNALPEEVKPIVTFAYHSGWRKNEILTLTWDRVNLKEGIVRLDPGETKNEEGRTLYLDGELLKEMQALHSKRQLGCQFVFHRNGTPIRGFRKAWVSACIQVGLYEVLTDDEGKPVVIKDKKGNEKVVKVPTKILHDFRRTAIRDMVRSGVSERVAMSISGHKTRSVFDRYNIVSDQDLREAAQKKQAYFEKQDATELSDPGRGEVIRFRQAQNE